MRVNVQTSIHIQNQIGNQRFDVLTIRSGSNRQSGIDPNAIGDPIVVVVDNG